jgi:hypothetical protein
LPRRRARRARGRAPDAGALAGALVDLLARWFADNRATVEAFRLDTADPDIPALIGFGRDGAGGDIRHAVAVARGAVKAEDLEAAIVKAALANGWSEQRDGGR